MDITTIISNNENKFVPYSAFEGSLYPVDGGMNETLKRIGVKDGIQLIDICGLHAFEKALNNLNPDKIDKTIFV